MRDTGPPELVMKRLRNETAEMLDICLERGIITLQQHWCGIHLRWLYTLRYGAPGLRAVDPTHLGGLDIKPDAPDWRSAREREFNDAMEKLRQHGSASLIINLCIYNERPIFLEAGKSASKNARYLRAQLCEGFDILFTHWKS